MTFIVDYRTYLKEKLEERCNVNHLYSLRAFSRDLGIEVSRLSRILRNQEGLSEISARKLASKLGLSEKETEYFINLVNSSDSRSKIKRKIASIKLNQYNDYYSKHHILQLDVFKIISDWYHYAIVELSTLPSFKSDPQWIAKKLGIAVHEAQAAIERLLRLNIIEKVGGKIKASTSQLMTTDGIPSEAIKKFNKQILSKAISSIDTQNINERDISTVTINIDPSDISDFKALIKKFRNEFDKYAEERKTNKRPSELYSLAIQFFRLSDKETL